MDILETPVPTQPGLVAPSLGSDTTDRQSARARSGPDPFSPQLEVVPWHDPDLDGVGHDPRSEYVERFWLGLLGPSTTWLLRRFARGLAEHPSGFRVDLTETGLALGLGDSVARNSSLQRSLLRACQFGVASRVSERRLAVRVRIPPLSRKQLARLPEPVRRAHEQWGHDLRGGHALATAIAAAEGLARVGEPLGVIERQLVAWGMPTDVAREAAMSAFGV